MKKKLINISVSALAFLILGIITTFLLSFLAYKEIIKPLTSEIVIFIVSTLLFFSFSLYLGYKCKKRGLILGLILFSIYFFFAFTFKNDLFSAINNIINFIIKSLSLISGAIIGVNIGTKLK